MKNIEDFIERLEQYGCCDVLLGKIHQLHMLENETEILANLKQYQTKNQNRFDEACKHIDCIDFLIYEIENKMDS